MTNRVIKTPIIKLKIETGPVSPAMRRAWVTFWNRLIASAKREVGQ